MLKLEAKTENERRILDYLIANASEPLQEKINQGEKTLEQCWSYIVSEAKKLQERGCACVADEVVYGWAVHFFEEDSIKAKIYSQGTVVERKPKKKATQKKTEEEKTNVPEPKKSSKQEKNALDQISLF